MKLIVRKWIPILIATFTGLVVLAGYLFPVWPLTYYRDHLIEWGVVVAAFAFILGLFNLLRVHSGRVVRLRANWLPSLVLLLTGLVAWIPPVLYGPSSEITRQVVDYVLGPLGASLAALVVFTLTLAMFRLMRTRRRLSSLLFVLIVALMLLGSTPLVGFEWLHTVREWIVDVPGMAGMRGLLLGVALGTLITALRVFIASERPHSEF